VERSDTHRVAADIDGYRCAPPILQKCRHPRRRNVSWGHRTDCQALSYNAAG